MTHQVTFVPGDTTGPEIFTHLKPLIARLDVDITWDEPGNTGSGQDEALGSQESLVASARRTGTVLMAWEKGDRDRGQLAPIVRLREALGVYANLRPLRSLSFLETRHPDVDILVVRETTEDIYAHLEHETLPGVFESLKVTTKAACERIARHAFETAREYKREKVTIVHKANIMKLSDGMFLRTAQEIAKDYPDIECDDCIVDALCMKLIIDPSQFDVLLCGNLFGDIVSDLTSGLVGGLSNAPSINIAEGVSIFTTAVGDPPELVGTGKGNPLSLLLPAVHMLRHLEENVAAERLMHATWSLMRKNLARPYAVGGESTIDAFFENLNEYI